LAGGIRRWGKVTSNSTETINGVFGNIRELPIVFMIEAIIKYQRQKYHERYLQACKWSEEGKRLTPYARDIQVEIAGKASKRQVKVIQQSHPIYRGRVQSSYNATAVGYLEVLVDFERRFVDCPCLFTDEMGISCVHGKALLLALHKRSVF
jgi:hypothetical protein